MANNKLTAEAWRSLLVTLHLPVEFDYLAVKQAGWLEHLLHYLMAHSPLARQSETTPEEWQIWLDEFLPVSLKFYLAVATTKIKLKPKRKTKKPKKSSAGQSLNNSTQKLNKESDNQVFDSPTSDFTLPIDLPAQSPIKSSVKLPRKPVSIALFTEVAVRQGLFCFWCGIRVVREAQIPTRGFPPKLTKYINNDVLQSILFETPKNRVLNYVSLYNSHNVSKLVKHKLFN